MFSAEATTTNVVVWFVPIGARTHDISLSRKAANYFITYVITTKRNKMKNTTYHTVGPVPNSNRKIVERAKNDCPKTKIRDRSLSSLGSVTTIKNGSGWQNVYFFYLLYLYSKKMYM